MDSNVIFEIFLFLFLMKKYFYKIYNLILFELFGFYMDVSMIIYMCRNRFLESFVKRIFRR